MVTKPKMPRIPALPTIRADLFRLGLMRAYEDTPAGTRFNARPEPSMAAQLFAEGGYGVVAVPPEIWSVETRLLLTLVVDLATNLRVPRNPMEAAIYGLMAELAERKQSMQPQVLALGLLMAAAEAQGVPISTPARELAKEAAVRYQTLLLVRRLALQQMEAWGVYNYDFRRFQYKLKRYGRDRYKPPG